MALFLLSRMASWAVLASMSHSFIPAISIAPLQVLYYSRGAPDYSMDTVSEFHVEAHRWLGKGLAQGPYVAATAGVEPTTLRLKVIDSTNAPPPPSLSVRSYFPFMSLFVFPILSDCPQCLKWEASNFKYDACTFWFKCCVWCWRVLY